MKKEKNLTGMALIAAMHLALALVAMNAKITIPRSPELVPASIFPPPVEPHYEPPQASMPMPEPGTPVFEIPPIPLHVLEQAAHTVTAQPQASQPPSTPSTSSGRAETASASAGNGQAAAPTTRVRVEAVVDAANCSKPEYPKAALRNGDEGVVTLAFLIGADGKVADSRVEKSSGFRDLDQAARKGLGLCRFKPGTMDGVPQPSWTQMQYIWSLEG